VSGETPARLFLRKQMDAGIFPGARYRIARVREVLEDGWIGRSVVDPQELPVGQDTLYDLASLTKPLVTGALAVLFQAQGAIDLAEPLERYLPETREKWLGRATLLDLLTHRSGLQAWLPLYLQARTREGYLSAVASLFPEYRAGSRVVYSCLGYIVLAAVLEKVGGARLDRLAEKEIFSRTGATETGFTPPERLRPRIAATEEGNARERMMVAEAGEGFAGWRRGVIWGECHDLNAWTLGGISGNAGLFSTTEDLHRLALEFLGEGTGLFGADELTFFRQDFTPGLNENRSVGWQLAATPGASAGPLLSPRAMGHTGFTGTSLWIDPDQGWILILLTNRVHPRYRPDDMNSLRREFHRVALAGACSVSGG